MSYIRQVTGHTYVPSHTSYIVIDTFVFPYTYVYDVCHRHICIPEYTCLYDYVIDTFVFPNTHTSIHYVIDTFVFPNTHVSMTM